MKRGKIAAGVALALALTTAALLAFLLAGRAPEGPAGSRKSVPGSKSPAPTKGRPPRAQFLPPLPPPAEIRWGQETEGLVIGLVPLGHQDVNDGWHDLVCPDGKCRQLARKQIEGFPPSPCALCRSGFVRNLANLCDDCARRLRTCRMCGRVRFRPGPKFRAAEVVAMEVHLKNVGGRKLELFDAACPFQWRVAFDSKERGLTRIALLPNRRLGNQSPGHLSLAPGEAKAIRLVLEVDWVFEHPGLAPNMWPSYGGRLRPGRYTVTASYEHVKPRRGKAAASWRGKITSGALEITTGIGIQETEKEKRAKRLAAALKISEARARQIAIQEARKRWPNWIQEQIPRGKDPVAGVGVLDNGVWRVVYYIHNGAEKSITDIRIDGRTGAVTGFTILKRSGIERIIPIAP